MFNQLSIPFTGLHIPPGSLSVKQKKSGDIYLSVRIPDSPQCIGAGKKPSECEYKERRINTLSQAGFLTFTGECSYRILFGYPNHRGYRIIQKDRIGMDNVDELLRTRPFRVWEKNLT
jgi:hypothetical protein